MSHVEPGSRDADGLLSKAYFSLKNSTEAKSLCKYVPNCTGKNSQIRLLISKNNLQNIIYYIFIKGNVLSHAYG